MENEIVRESLEPRRLAHCKVANPSIREENNILASRHAVVASLQRLRRLIKWAASMASVGPGTGVRGVVVESRAVPAFWIGKVRDGVPDGAPGLFVAGEESLLGIQPFDAGLEL